MEPHHDGWAPSATLDAVVAHTRGDETVREAVSVFIDHADHAETLIEQGGSIVLLSAPPKDVWLQFTIPPAHQ